MREFKVAVVTFFLVTLVLPLRAAEIEPASGSDLLSLDVEQLLNLKVTTISKTPQDWFRAAAAVHVITGDDIRRSGATSLAEALRLAPGVQVARLNSNQWAVGIRGFQSRLARATLVMIDGRTVYTPLFAGTYWEMQDVMLEDIERIEVIRGPGGAVWGANAVNGVINIITKGAAVTQGTLLTAGGGTEERGFGAVRYGGRAGERLYYRLYGKYFDRDASFTVAGDDFDDWHMSQSGFRADWEVDERQSFTFQGDAYEGRAGQRVSLLSYSDPVVRRVHEDTEMFGANFLSRWTRSFGDRSRLSAQVYYDHVDRKDPDLSERRDTMDVDVHHTLGLGSRNRVTYGAGYRITGDRAGGMPTIKDFRPSRRSLELWNVFLQDEIELVRERLDLTLGAKAEKNEYTGWEYQPSGRLSWAASRRQTLWGAVSRAVRTPSRIDREPDIILGLSPPPPVLIVGRIGPNEKYESETLLAYELGYRAQPTDTFRGEVNGFYNRYDDVQSLFLFPTFLESDPPPAKFVIPFVFENRMRGRIYGTEVNAAWSPLVWWRIEASYSYAHINFHQKEGTTDAVSEASLETSSPQHQAMFRSSMDLPGSFELDPIIRYVGRIPSQAAPAYWTADLRLGWQNGRRDLELALVGQNLFQRRHAEYGTANQIERGVYAKATWRR